MPAPTTTQIAAPTQSASPSPSAAEPAAETTGVPPWLWWLLGAVAVAIAVAVPLLLRASRRRTWHADFAAAEGETAWFARVFIPELRRAGSLDRLAGAWAVGSSRVSALEDRLTALEATAPDDPNRARARWLRDAVRAARDRLNVSITAGALETLQQDLDSAAAEVEAMLTASDRNG